MGALDGRVAIITGAGRGLGREHARLFAAEGAKVVVNDLGDVAEEAAEEIRAAGGEAIASNHDITSWAGGEALVGAAVDAFGRLDVLVNNAGILRDRMLVSMSEEEWDDDHRRPPEGPLRAHSVRGGALAGAGEGGASAVQASIIHTSSTSGLLGNPGQTNYGAAKAGIGSFSIICAQELARYGVRSNCIAPAARTRLTEATPGLGEVVAAPDRRLRPVGSGQRVAARRLPRHGELRGHRSHVLRAGRHGAGDGAVAHGRARSSATRGGRSPSSKRRFPTSSVEPPRPLGERARVLCTISAEVVPGSLGRRAGRGVPQPPR